MPLAYQMRAAETNQMTMGQVRYVKSNHPEPVLWHLVFHGAPSRGSNGLCHLFWISVGLNPGQPEYQGFHP